MVFGMHLKTSPLKAKGALAFVGLMLNHRAFRCGGNFGAFPTSNHDPITLGLSIYPENIFTYARQFSCCNHRRSLHLLHGEMQSFIRGNLAALANSGPRNGLACGNAPAAKEKRNAHAL